MLDYHLGFDAHARRLPIVVVPNLSLFDFTFVGIFLVSTNEA